MRFTHQACHCVVIILLIGLPSGGAQLSPDNAVATVADYLTTSQVSDGNDAGLWPGEELFMGPIVAGMADAYEWTGSTTYFFIARFGAFYFAHAADLLGSLLGDEAYACVRMSQVSGLPEPPYWDFWREALVEFYESLRRPGYEGSTQQYLRYFDGLDPSTNVFYFAHHVVAADFVDDPDKDVWREAMLAELPRVDDTSDFPVIALAAATWALAKTNTLDDTLVTSDPACPYWAGVALRDLPSLLLKHQVPEGEPFGGSFYWCFNHEGEDLAGYTEDTAYATRALAAVASLEANRQNEELSRAIALAETALLQGIGEDGRVYEHLSQSGETRYVFAGEMLEGLWSVKEYRDAQAEYQKKASLASATGNDR